jgi:hypothetical protein
MPPGLAGVVARNDDVHALWRGDDDGSHLDGLLLRAGLLDAEPRLPGRPIALV